MVCHLNQCQHITQSYYSNTEPTSPGPILTMPCTKLGSDKYQFESHWFDSTRVGMYGMVTTKINNGDINKDLF